MKKSLIILFLTNLIFTKIKTADSAEIEHQQVLQNLTTDPQYAQKTLRAAVEREDANTIQELLNLGIVKPRDVDSEKTILRLKTDKAYAQASLQNAIEREDANTVQKLLNLGIIKPRDVDSEKTILRLKTDKTYA